jgi:hypothetical protein
MKTYRAQKGETFMTRNRAANDLRRFASRLGCQTHYPW